MNQKVLVIGGTTEGRLAASVLDEAGKPFLYSTLSGLQQVDIHHGTVISGALCPDDIPNIAPGLIVDAAHPFAVEAHRMAVAGGALAGVPVVRFDRPDVYSDGRAVYCDSYDEAILAMEADGVKRLLALSGVRTISRLKRWWNSHPDTYFRILNREESRQEAVASGFPLSKLCYYTGSEADTPVLLDRLMPDGVITKESGHSGGFELKLQAALDRGIRVYVVRRPPLPDGYAEVVYGPIGLRLAVQRLLPGFFKFNIGLTTGTCATAAAVAASRLLAGDDSIDSVPVILPSGEPVDVPVYRYERIDDWHARSIVVKDGGDDPDVTTGLEIVADVAVVDAAPGVTVNGGEGVGRATLPGLGIKVGDAAINSVPCAMIREQVQAVLPDKAVEVTVSVPRGREIAARTFNPRLGVSGGISIIGTSGVVRPFSNDAFVESLRRQISVAVASGCDTLVLNSGARSERAMKASWPQLPSVAFIHYGNLIGEAVQVAAEAGVQNIVVGIMIGKLVKLAAGNLDTHSGNVIMSHEFILEVGREAGLSDVSLQAISAIKLARELWQLLSADPAASAFYQSLIARAHKQLQHLASAATLSLNLIPDH